jgi:hypothetical protein
MAYVVTPAKCRLIHYPDYEGYRARKAQDIEVVKRRIGMTWADLQGWRDRRVCSLEYSGETMAATGRTGFGNRTPDAT